MGIFSNLLAGGAGETIKGTLEGVGTLATDIRSAITGEISPEAKAELEAKTLQIESKILMAQAEINKAEAQHASLFVSGWRPFIGWVCGTALLYNFLVAPLVSQFSKLAMLPLDIGPLITLLIGMLGIAGLRTVEKANGTQGNH